MKYDVVICTYNGEKYIDTQLESIVLQSKPPERIIVSDDGSSDLTISIVRETFKRLGYTSFLIVNGPKEGIVSNFFFALRKSHANYTFFADQDDIWKVNKAQMYFDFLQSSSHNPLSPVLLFSDSSLINKDGALYEESFFKYEGLSTDVLKDDSILYKNCVQGATVMINDSLRHLIYESLDCVVTKDILMHDWWLAIIAKYFGNILFVKERTLLYRQHDNNVVGARKYKSRLIGLILKSRKKFLDLINISKQKNHALKFISTKKAIDNKMVIYPVLGRAVHCGRLKKMLVDFISYITFLLSNKS